MSAKSIARDSTTACSAPICPVTSRVVISRHVRPPTSIRRRRRRAPELASVAAAEPRAEGVHAAVGLEPFVERRALVRIDPQFEVEAVPADGVGPGPSCQPFETFVDVEKAPRRRIDDVDGVGVQLEDARELRPALVERLHGHVQALPLAAVAGDDDPQHQDARDAADDEAARQVDRRGRAR